MKLRLLSLALVLFMGSSAFAWNCSDPLASRVDVGTTKPSGTSGNGDGQWFLGNGGEGTAGHYYVCQVPKTDPKHGGKGNHIQQTQTQTQNQNQTANGGNATSTANGGNAVSGSTSSAGVNNSGNSSNTNTNTAQGGAGGSASSTNTNDNQSSASASGNGVGNGNNSNNYTSTYKAADIPVSTAFAPTTIPTVSCFKGFGAGVQTMPVGASFGGGKIDANCRALQTALHAPNRLTYCKLYINLQDSKAAHITMEDCMQQDPKEEVSVPPPAPQQPTVIVVPGPSVAATVTPAIVPSVPPVVEEVIPVGICTFAGKTSCTPAGGDAGIVDPTRPTSVCKEMIASALSALARHPGYVVVLRGNRNTTEDGTVAKSRAERVRKQFEAAGVKSSQIKTEVGGGSTRTVEITLVPAVR